MILYILQRLIDKTNNYQINWIGDKGKYITNIDRKISISIKSSNENHCSIFSLTILPNKTIFEKVEFKVSFSSTFSYKSNIETNANNKDIYEKMQELYNDIINQISEKENTKNFHNYIDGFSKLLEIL